MSRSKLISVCLMLFIALTTLTSCEAIAGIFKAGIWVGVLVVVGIIALVLYLVGRGRK